MANIFFNPTSQSLPTSEAQNFSVEATYSFAGELPDTQDDWQIGEVSTPEGVTQNSRTLVTSSSQEQVYAYSFHTDANSTQFERAIILQFSMLKTGDDGVLKLYRVSQPGQSTPVTHPSLSLSPAQVRFLSSEVSVASVTASIQNPGSSLSLTPTSPSWVTVNPNTTQQVGNNLLIKTFLLTASANQSATARDSFVSFSLETAGETLVDSVSVSQPGRASVLVPTVNWAGNLFEFESEGASVGTAAYISGTVASCVAVTGDHTPTVNYTTTNNVITASVQFNVPANSTNVTRSTYMTVSAWNSAGTASSVLEIRTAGTDAPTPVLPSGSIVVTNSPYTASANENSYTFTVRYVNCVSGEYTIDGAGGGTGMDNPVSQSTTIDGNDKVVTYLATFPNNLTAEPITRRAFFQMHRGEGSSAEYVYGQGLIYQEGTYAPGGTGVIIQNTPVSVAANVTQSTFFVTYSNALQDPWVIHYPSFSLGAYLIDSTSRDSGQDTIRTYTVGFPANQTTNPVTHSAFFKMSYGQYHDEDIGYIYQAAAEPSPTTYSISCSWDYYDAGAVQQIARTIKVTYYGGQYPDDFVGNPITSSNIVGLSATPITSPYPDHCEITYGITASNNGQNATVTFNIPRASVTKTVTIHFSGAPDPGTPEIVVPGSPFNIASGDQIVTFTATYKNSYPGWTVLPAGTNKSDMHIVSSSVQVIGSDQQVTYEVTFPGNAGDLPVDRRVFLEMTSGSGAGQVNKSGQAIINQAGRLQVGSITLQPSRAWVAYSDTQSTFFATYSFNGLAYEIQNPVGYQCNVTTVDTRTLDNGDQVYQYRVTFPTNPSTNTPVSRSVDVRMITGSITAIETYIVAQDYQGGGGSKQILVNPTSKWIEHDQITATTQVTYMGYSSAAQIGTPSCPSGWSATVGNVQESSGQVTINWIFTGTPNTGTGTKTNTFTIGATGATSKTFTIFQYGTGGGGGSETTYVSPVWEKHEVSSSLASDTLVVTSGSRVIFNDRVYASPEGTLKVDLNRICEPFVVSDTLPYPYAKDERGDGWVVGGGLKRSFNIPHFTATLQSTGKTYEGYVLRDWSYKDPVKTEGIVSSTGIIPMAAGQPFMGTIINATEYVRQYEAIDEDGTVMQPLNMYTYADVVWSTGNLCGPFTLRYTSTGETRQGMVTSNSKWVVYFRNKRNGVEWIVLDGPVVPMVEVTRNNYLQGVVRYTKSYLNKVVNRWKCNTGIMSDQWSYLVSEMIESTQVGLLDLNTFTMWQVRPITTTVEQKTFWNQGRKFATYQFDLEHVLNQARR